MKKYENLKQYIILILIAVIAYWITNNLNVIGSIILKIWNVLLPFTLGIAIAFILNIPMTKIEKILNKQKDSKNISTRIISITLSLLLFIFIIGFVLFLLIPEIINNIESLITSLPNLFNTFENWIINLLDKYPDVQKEIQKIFATNNIETMIPTFLDYIVNGAISFITKLISGMITVFMAIVFSIYILCQKEYLLNGLKKIITAYTSPKYSKKLIEIGKLSNQTFTKFVSGQCVEAVILGTIFFVVLSICRFPYALMISALTTITALIPIFGAMIAMIIGAILIAIESPFQAIIFIIIFQVIQQIEGNIIYPRVVGKSVGLSPLWTLLAVTTGGSLFGVLGMLISLPIASIVYALLKNNVQERLKEKRKTNI